MIFENDFKPIQRYMGQAIESLLVPPEAVRLPFWPKLDQIIGGLRPYEYTILCGSTGSGKTAWTSALIEQAATRGTPCAVASIENGPVDFTRRTIGSRVGKNWNEGDVIPAEKVDDFRRHNPDFEDSLPISVATYEDRINNGHLMKQVAEQIEHNGVKLVVLDNFNFFTEVRSPHEELLEIDRVVHNWIIFCKTCPVHVIMIMHPRKTDGGRVKNEFDVKGSSTCVQEAHNVLLFNRLPSDLVDKKPEYLCHFREITIAKCRRRGKGIGKAVTYQSWDGASFEERIPDPV